MSEAQRILLVDDDPPVLDIFTRMVERIGFQVIPVNNGPDALTIFRQNSFDAVIADYRLAGMNGIELARRIREIRPQIPVLVLTGLSDPAIKNTALAQGLSFMTKPVLMPEMRDILEDLLPAEEG